MLLKSIRYSFALLFDVAVLLVTYDLLIDLKYGFGIFLLFGFFVPFRMILILTAPQISRNRKMLFLATSFVTLLLSIYWSRNNLDWLLWLICGLATIDVFVDSKLLSSQWKSLN
jgi:hypothetical protein